MRSQYKDCAVIMNILETSYFHNNKRFCVLLGQWPFQSSIRQNCLRCVVLMLISSILLPKMIKFFEVIHDFDGIIECLPMIGLHMASLTRFFNCIFNSNKMKHLLVRIQRDWNDLKFAQDIKIMQEFYERGRMFTLAYATALFSILGLFFVSPMIPITLDILYPLNETRGRIYLYQTEYFVDQDEYYVAILIHAYVTVPISLGVLVFAENMFAMYIHHACGLFRRLRLQLESIHISINDDENREIELKRTAEFHREIVTCVNMHENVIEFSNELESSSNMSYLIILMINVTMITITGIVTVMKLNEPSEAVRFLAFTAGNIVYTFFSCFMGQKLIDESAVVFHAAYSFEWYAVPMNLQSMVTLIMIRSINPCQLTAGKVITLSMDTFSLVLKNAMSLFTVVSSMQ